MCVMYNCVIVDSLTQHTNRYMMYELCRLHSREGGGGEAQPRSMHGYVIYATNNRSLRSPDRVMLQLHPAKVYHSRYSVAKYQGWPFGNQSVLHTCCSTPGQGAAITYICTMPVE